MPNETDEEKEKWRQLLGLFFPGLNLDDSTTNPNEPIIEEWKNAIDFYGQTFRRKTIVLTQGAGLLSFDSEKKHPKEAKLRILNYFADNKTLIGNNLKATQTSGLKACRGNHGLQNTKGLTKDSARSPRILGGAMFNSSATEYVFTMGCPDKRVCGKELNLNKKCQKDSNYHQCFSLRPHEAIQNSLKNYFHDTPFGDQYCDSFGSCGTKGEAPIHYLQIYKPDISAAETDSQVQALLMKANRDILAMNQMPSPSTTPSPNVSKKPRGVYAVIFWNESPKSETWQNPYVDGLVIRTYWRDVNPKEGVYNWAYLDSQFEKSRKNNKKLHLIIAPGVRSPQWVKDRVPTVKFKIPYGVGVGQLHDFSIPWNEDYLNLWFAFIEKVAQRYGNDPALGFISAVGPNSHNGEMSLPKQGEDENGSPITWLDVVEGQNRREKINNLKERLLEAWFRTFRAFNTAFNGKTHFTLALAIKAIPAPGVSEDEQQRYKKEIIEQAVAKFPSTFGLQSNGLDGRSLWPDQEPNWNWEKIGSYSGAILTGFQTNAPSKLYPGPEDPKPENISKADILRQTVDNALTRKVNCIEIYEQDVNDPNKQDVIRYAHKQLVNSS